MTDQQKRFAEEYVKTLDPQKSYKAAYPHVKKDMSAAAGASRLLNDVKFRAVQAYISELMEQTKKKSICDAQEVLEYLSSVVRGESESEVMVVEGEGPGITQARRKLKRPDEKERLKAAELMSKYHQLLTPRVEITTDQPGGVVLLAPVLPDE